MLLRLLVPVLVIGGSCVAIASSWVGSLRLVGAGGLIALAGVALGVWVRQGTVPERLASFAEEFDRGLPSGGTGRKPTPRSATTGVVYATVTALCWLAVFLLGGDVGGSPAATVLAVAGTLLLLGGQVERLARTWRSWRKALAWLAALPASLTLVVVHEWVAGLAFGAVLMYGIWTWPGIHGWERRRRRWPRPSRPGRRARRRARRASGGA